MSQTSTEPPILAKQISVQDNTIGRDTVEIYKAKSDDILSTHAHRNIRRASTVSETTDHTSSALWTPSMPAINQTKEKQSLSRKSHRKKGRSSHKNEKTTESEATTSKQENIHLLTSEKPSSFERNYKDRISGRRRYNNASEKQQMRQGSKDSRKKIPELYNDYTRYQYHRKSNKEKHRKHKSRSHRKRKEEITTGSLPKLFQRVKDFFTRKTDNNKENRRKKSPNRERKEHEHFHQHGTQRAKHKRELSGKLFRSASDSDLEAVKHHRRHRGSLHKKSTRDDMLRQNKHWKSRRHHDKLSSIYESSDRSGRTGTSDGGKLMVTRRGKATFNDTDGYKDTDTRRMNGKIHKKRDTSDGSHSHESSSHEKRRSSHHRRSRSKEYQSLKKKWAKQHESFENDLEKMEKLLEMIGMKKTEGWLELRSSESTTLLERLEATQEKCVAEVDFTRHVLICKLQRLENRLEESLSSMDYSNNNHLLMDNQGRSVNEIRDEMSKEYRDLRKLLEETSTQLKQVLDEKQPTEIDGEETASPLRNGLNTQIRERNEDASTTDVPFPELSHHPLNTRDSREKELVKQTSTKSEKKDTARSKAKNVRTQKSVNERNKSTKKDKVALEKAGRSSPTITRVTTYV